MMNAESDASDDDPSVGAAYNCTEIDGGPEAKTTSADEDSAPADEISPSSGRDGPPAGASAFAANVANSTAGGAKEESAADGENATLPNEKSIAPSLRHHSSTYLNVALESLESMRRLNLEVEISNAIPAFRVCTYCQREELQKLLANPPPPAGEGQQRGINIGSVNFDGSRIRNLHKSLTEPRQQPAARKVNVEVQEEQRGINMGKVKLDGSRVRRFQSNVRGFFAKPGLNEGDDSSRATEMTTKPYTPSLGNENLSSLSEETSTSNDGNRASSGRRNILKKAPRPCLTCGHPTCSRHSSSTFSKKNIPLCQSCAYLFELDFLVDVIASTASNPKECQKKVDEMVDCYDRAKLLLVYIAQYADEIASALETHTVRSNKISAGSSATGVVSGITGVVGCGAMLFPPVAVAGVPLLIASLVFGGGATALQSGDAAARHFSEPNRLAEKMVALHGMVLSLLRITEVLSYGLSENHLGANHSAQGFSENGEEGMDEEAHQRELFRKEINELLEKHGVTTTKAAVEGLQAAVASGIVATRVAATSTRIVATEAAAFGAPAISASSVASGASMVGRGSRYVGRVGTTAGAGMRFIPIAGGLLSAACVFVEGRELKRTLDRIGEGNPCAKAEQVRAIRDEVDILPDSSLIAAECRLVFELATFF